MEIDLRKNGILAINLAKEINILEPIVRDEYNEYIGKLTSANNIKEIGWLSEVTCRNTFASEIHNQMCKLALLESHLDQDSPITSVLIDHEMYQPVNDLLKKYNKSFNDG